MGLVNLGGEGKFGELRYHSYLHPYREFSLFEVRLPAFRYFSTKIDRIMSLPVVAEEALSEIGRGQDEKNLAVGESRSSDRGSTVVNTTADSVWTIVGCVCSQLFPICASELLTRWLKLGFSKPIRWLPAKSRKSIYHIAKSFSIMYINI